MEWLLACSWVRSGQATRYQHLQDSLTTRTTVAKRNTCQKESAGKQINSKAATTRSTDFQSGKKSGPITQLEMKEEQNKQRSEKLLKITINYYFTRVGFNNAKQRQCDTRLSSTSSANHSNLLSAVYWERQVLNHSVTLNIKKENWFLVKVETESTILLFDMDVLSRGRNEWEANESVCAIETWQLKKQSVCFFCSYHSGMCAHAYLWFCSKRKRGDKRAWLENCAGAWRSCEQKGRKREREEGKRAPSTPSLSRIDSALNNCGIPHVRLQATPEEAICLNAFLAPIVDTKNLSTVNGSAAWEL